jgi:hypothetical protein
MTTQEEYEEMKRRVGFSSRETFHSSSSKVAPVDLSMASDADLERYRDWLKAKSDLTTRSSEGPNVY